MRSRSARLPATAVLALAVLGLSPAFPAAAGTPPETTIRPASLERGEGPGIPQVLGTWIHDGDRRIEVDAVEVQLLGTSGDEYVVLAYPPSGRARVQRIAAAGSNETIMTKVDGDTALSRDGEQVFESVVHPDARTVVTVRDAATGDREARRTFRGYVRVLDADDGRAVLGGSSPTRTWRWHAGNDDTKKISGKEGYFADIHADRFATFTGRGEDACSVLSTLPPKSEVLWRSCTQAVVATSADGERVVSQNVFTDGPVGRLQVRGDHGRLIATYDTPGFFGRAAFERKRAVLMQVHGTKKAALVRCVGGDCERASRRIDAP